jgi:hypothetical protein
MDANSGITPPPASADAALSQYFNFKKSEPGSSPVDTSTQPGFHPVHPVYPVQKKI